MTYKIRELFEEGFQLGLTRLGLEEHLKIKQSRIKIQSPACYRCSMPGPHVCEFPGCRVPMCGKHRIRKAGGSLCDKHKHARLEQPIGVGSTRFKNAGKIARPSAFRFGVTGG